MGREEGSNIFHTHSWDGTNHIISWYCQQHQRFEQRSNINIINASDKLDDEYEIIHGNEEQ